MPPPAPTPDPRRARGLELGLALSVLTLIVADLGPALRAPGRLGAGDPAAEGAAHLWGLWVAADALPAHGPGLRAAAADLPAGLLLDHIDPINLVVLLPALLLGGGGAAGAALGWNLLVAGTTALWAWGGHRLGLRLTGDRRAAALLGLLLAAAPSWHGSVLPLGRSEYFPWCLWPLHLSLLHEALHGAGPARRRAEALAALSLGAMGWAGWQPLLWLIFAELPAVALLRRRADGPPAPWAPALRVGAAAALATAPLLLRHLALRPWWLSRLELPSPVAGTGQVTPPAELFTGAATLLHGELPPFLGYALPLMALAALRGPGRGWALAGLAGAPLLIGHGVELADRTLLLGPAGALAHVVPPLRGLRGWSRATPLVAVLMAVAAVGLPWARRRWGLAIGAWALAEGLLWRPLGAGAFPVAPGGPARALSAALPEGPTLALLGDRSTAAGAAHHDLHLLHARALDRPTSAGPSAGRDPAVLGLSVLAVEHHRRGPPPAGLGACAPGEAGRLWAAGFRAVWLQPPAGADPAWRRRARARAEDLLGAPIYDDGVRAGWALRPAEAGPCP